MSRGLQTNSTNSLETGIDNASVIVYNGSMMTQKEPSKLNRENVRMVGIPAELHARIKAIAERDALPMYEVVDKAIDRYERWTMITSALASVNGAEPQP